MALPSTIHRLDIDLSDVDRGVYTQLELRLARHPSESLRYLITRALAYALCHEEGIAFSRGGLSSTDEAPVAVTDPTGRLLHWIDIGTPSPERLHKAAKAADSVSLFTSSELVALRRAAASIHRAAEIAVTTFPQAFLDGLGDALGRRSSLDLLRNDGWLHATLDGQTFEAPLTLSTLLGA